MSENQLVKQLIGQSSQATQAYEIYLQTTNIYLRTKAIMGAFPQTRVLTSSAKTVRVGNDTTWSTKILTRK